MHRLFVAIRPPRAMRAALLSRMGGIPGARWQDDDQLHLTLRFIGEVDRPLAEDIAVALGAIHHPRFALALHGSGRFERRGRIDSLWWGVTPHEAITALHHKIDRQLVRLGLPPEGRAYLPHITLARFSRSNAPADAMIAAPVEEGQAHPIADFCLYESDLGSDGALYSIIARYPLD
jgi:2'-5' RNA ligase